MKITIMIFFMLATLISLITGVLLMACGGKINKKYSNRLMSLRVTFQALTIILLFIFMYNNGNLQ